MGFVLSKILKFSAVSCFLPSQNGQLLPNMNPAANSEFVGLFWRLKSQAPPGHFCSLGK